MSVFMSPSVCVFLTECSSPSTTNSLSLSLSLSLFLPLSFSPSPFFSPLLPPPPLSPLSRYLNTFVAAVQNKFSISTASLVFSLRALRKPQKRLCSLKTSSPGGRFPLYCRCFKGTSGVNRQTTLLGTGTVPQGTLLCQERTRLIRLKAGCCTIAKSKGVSV